MDNVEQKQYFKNFVRLFSGNTIGQLVPFIFAPIVARLFTPEQIGIQESFLSVAGMFAIIAAGRYEIAFVLEENRTKAINLLALALCLVLGFGVLGTLLGIFPQPILFFFKDAKLRPHLYFLGLAISLLALQSVITQWLLREGSYGKISWVRILQSFIQNGGYAIAGYWAAGVHGLLIAWLIGAFIPVLVMGYQSLRKVEWNIVDRQTMKEEGIKYKDFPMINSLHAFTDLVATSFLLLGIISNHFGLTALGMFALMNRYLRAPLALVSGTLAQLYYREAGALLGQKRSIKPIFLRTQRLMLLVLVPVTIVILVWGPDIFALYLGEKWRNAGVYAKFLLPAIISNFITSAISSSPLLFNKQRWAYVFSVSGYALSLSALYLTASLHWQFQYALLAYACVLVVYYLSLVAWYYSLIIKHDRDVNIG
jgi:O-antigen/teichoic acid export membrane protein